MKRAAEELAQTDKPIIDIALKYQYAAQESFTRAFMMTYGLTPGKYRKTYGSGKFNHVNNLSSHFNGITDMTA